MDVDSRWRASVTYLGGLFVPVVDGPLTSAGSSWSGPEDDLTGAGVRVTTPWCEDVRLEVETSSPPGPHVLTGAKALLGSFIRDAVFSVKEPVFPFELRIERWDATLPVDGEPVSFTFVGNRDEWRAVGPEGERTASLSARGWRHEDVALRWMSAEEALAGGVAPSSPSYATPEEAALAGWAAVPRASPSVVKVEPGHDEGSLWVTVQLDVDNPGYDQEVVTVERRPDGRWVSSGSTGSGSG